MSCISREQAIAELIEFGHTVEQAELILDTDNPEPTTTESEAA